MVDFDQIKQNRYIYSIETGKKYFSNQELFQSKEKYINLRFQMYWDREWNFRSMRSIVELPMKLLC